MSKINGNDGTNLNAVNMYYETSNTKKAKKEEKTTETKPVVEFTPKTDADGVSALDATAAQIWGIHLTKNVDKSDVATTNRLEKAIASSKFMTALNGLQGVDVGGDFPPTIALARATACDPEKLGKYLKKPLSESTTAGFSAIAETSIV